MNTPSIKAISFHIFQIGRHLKGSKRRYFWILSIGQRVYNFVLDDSLVTGKSKLIINGRVFHCAEKIIGGSSYNHTFIIEGCLFSIAYKNDEYEMRINNNTFSHMLNFQKKQEEFKQHQVEENSFQWKQPEKPVSQKKITLSLPGMNNPMKKKKNSIAQSDNWSAFCQQDSFNSFASEKPTQTATTKAPKQILSTQPICEIKQQKQQSSQMTNLPSPIEIKSQEEFRTLQNLFKTMIPSEPFENKNKEGEIAVINLEQIPNFSEINVQDFSTIQQLFATNCYQNHLPLQKEAPKPIIEPVSQKCQVKNNDFNTMQNLFQTIKKNTENDTISKPEKTPVVVDFKDFNTMQNLFATNLNFQTKNETQTKQILPQQINKSISNNLPIVNQSPFDEFTSITSNFGTNTNALQTCNGSNTILSSTNKTNESKGEIKAQVVQKSKVQEQKIKPESAIWNDFNTMQNLFKTGAPNKKENEFWKF